MNCGCGTNCNPPCEQTGFLPGMCPDEVQQGNLMVLDECCNPRKLIGKGVVASLNESGESQLTDGSDLNGHIFLNPPSVGGSDYILALVSGIISKLVASEEGAVLVWSGGKFAFIKDTEANTLFDPAQLRSTNDTLAGFACGPNGNVHLGKFIGLANTIIYFDEDRELVNMTLPDFQDLLVSQLCAQIPTVGDTDVVLANIVCTDNGIRKGQAANSYLWLTQWDLAVGVSCAAQVGYIFNGALYPQTGTNFDPLPAWSILPAGPGNTSVAYNYTTVPDYDPAYANAVFVLRANHASASAADAYHVVINIDGREYMRVGGAAISDTDTSEIIVPIPVNKLSQITIYFQNPLTPFNGAFQAGVWLIGFVK